MSDKIVLFVVFIPNRAVETVQINKRFSDKLTFTCVADKVNRPVGGDHFDNTPYAITYATLRLYFLIKNCLILSLPDLVIFGQTVIRKKLSKI